MKSILSQIYYQIIRFLLPKIYDFFNYYYNDFKKRYNLIDETIKIDKNKKSNKKQLRNKVKNTKFFQLWHIKNQLKNFTAGEYKFIDIGSGWGTILIFFNHYFNFKQLIGVENYKKAANSSKKIIKLNNLKKIKIINKNGKKFKWEGNSIIYLNIVSKSLIDSILEFNKKNIQNKKNVIIIPNLDQFKHYKNHKLLKNYNYRNYSLLRYFIFFN